jgi:ATP-dependent Clp protease adaptor protein ClpS
MDSITQITPTPEIIEDQNTTLTNENKVVLYNDDWHTFEEVIVQLIKAVSCSFERARSLAFEAHTIGKAVVFTGTIQDCLKVSSVLEEIALNTQIIS